MTEADSDIVPVMNVKPADIDFWGSGASGTE
jgi:hypothetical protein